MQCNKIWCWVIKTLLVIKIAAQGRNANHKGIFLRGDRNAYLMASYDGANLSYPTAPLGQYNDVECTMAMSVLHHYSKHDVIKMMLQTELRSVWKYEVTSFLYTGLPLKTILKDLLSAIYCQKILAMMGIFHLTSSKFWIWIFFCSHSNYVFYS